MIKVHVGTTVLGEKIYKEYTYSQLKDAAAEWQRRLSQGGVSEADRQEGEAIVAAAEWVDFRRQVQGPSAPENENFEW